MAQKSPKTKRTKKTTYFIVKDMKIVDVAFVLHRRTGHNANGESAVLQLLSLRGHK